ncbi:hypothetical protein KSF_076700 [Reticulibacter mediterranei]|uniref:Uncharacterized protein n=1 Tax=Reticulibacter mediterranei TaxID=2778369 RepID=A0A8J3N7W7_9CHLR|nr:hypothetical protein KSF_076700 [Reticulibacter mediterranei]
MKSGKEEYHSEKEAHDTAGRGGVCLSGRYQTHHMGMGNVILQEFNEEGYAYAYDEYNIMMVIFPVS